MTQFFRGMREIDVGRGTESGAAKFAAVFGLSTKKTWGACPPIGARVNKQCTNVAKMQLKIGNILCSLFFYTTFSVLVYFQFNQVVSSLVPYLLFTRPTGGD